MKGPIRAFIPGERQRLAQINCRHCERRSDAVGAIYRRPGDAGSDYVEFASSASGEVDRAMLGSLKSIVVWCPAHGSATLSGSRLRSVVSEAVAKSERRAESRRRRRAQGIVLADCQPVV